MAHILVVGLESAAGTHIIKLLEADGHRVTSEPVFKEEFLKKADYDLIAGEITENITTITRQVPDLSPIVITANPQVDEAVQVLHDGAADYVALADLTPERLRLAIRRALGTDAPPNGMIGSGGRLAPGYTYLRDLAIDEAGFRALFRGQVLPLSPTEFNILRCLVRARGHVVTFEEIVRQVQHVTLSRHQARSALSAHISNLRAKLTAAGCTDYLMNRRGLGYYIELDVQQELRRSEARLHMLTQHTRDAIGQTAMDGTIRYLSPRIYNITGIPPEDTIGTHINEWLKRVHPDDIAAWPAIQPGQSMDVTFRFRHADGHYIWLESRGEYFRDEASGEEGLVSVIRDVTEHLQTLAALRHSEALLDALLASSPALIARLDRELRYVYIAPSAHWAFNLPVDALLDRRFDEHPVVGHETAGLWGLLLRNLFVNGQSIMYAYSLNTESGPMRLLAHLLPEKDENEWVHHVVLVLASISHPDMGRALRRHLPLDPEPPLD